MYTCMLDMTWWNEKKEIKRRRNRLDMTYYKNCQQQNKSKCRQLLEFICWGFRVHMNEDKLLLCSISFKCVSTFFCMNSSWMSNVYVYSVQFYYVFYTVFNLFFIFNITFCSTLSTSWPHHPGSKLLANQLGFQFPLQLSWKPTRQLLGNLFLSWWKSLVVSEFPTQGDQGPICRLVFVRWHPIWL